MKGESVAICFSGHDNNFPTLNFDFETNSFYCDKCRIKGTVVDLVREYWDVDEELATRWLEKNFILRKKWSDVVI